MGRIHSAFIHRRVNKKMVSKKTRIGCTLLVLNFLHIHAFETDKCDHESLTTVLGKTRSTCWDSKIESREDICGQFEKTRECVASNLDKCFHQENIKKITKETLADLSISKTEMLLNPVVQKAQGFNLSKAEVDSLFSVCPNIPDKTFIENLGYWEWVDAGVSTDNNCTEEEITDFNAESEKCLDSEFENTEAWLGRISAHRGSKQSAICLDFGFDLMVENCLKKTSPSCLSMRERSFLKTNLVEPMHYLLKKLFDLAGENLPEFELDCSDFSGSVMPKPSTSIAYIVFSIPLFYVNMQ